MEEMRSHINTGGGDAAHSIDKRKGVFSERDVYGAAVYANYGTITNVFSKIRETIAEVGFCKIGLPEPLVQGSLLTRDHLLKRIGDAVLNEDEPPLALFYGLPGVGKTSLVAQFAHEISQAQFRNGVLWANLEVLAPHELLGRFLSLLPDEQGATVPRLDAPLRDVFWNRLCGRGAQWLVIIDQVRDRQQLAELLPSSAAVLGQSRICIICQEPFDLQLSGRPITPVEISSLTPYEADKLFEKLIPARRKNGRAAALRRIGELVEFNTQMLVSCTNLINTGAMDPHRLLDGLQDRGLQPLLLSASQQRTLEFIIGDLPASTQALIPYLGVLSAGDWSPKMLAATALRNLSELIDELRPLEGTRLITRLEANHYRSSSLLRQHATGLLAASDPYRAQSAYILLTRYCLDRAQDLEESLLQHSRRKGEPGETLTQHDPEFIAEFRRGLTLELPHIRHVLNWAAQEEQWDLIRRFSFLPYLEMVQHFSADGFEITTSLLMATIWEPTVWEPQSPASIRIPTLERTVDWSIYPKGAREHSGGGIRVIEEADRPVEQGGDNTSDRCRLNWTVTASHLVGAVFRKACLTEARWTGVQARELILYDCDAVGVVMQACDLGNSVWLHTDARYAKLSGSSMRGVLMRHVQLTGASLRGVDLTGAVLEHVQLRGADLRDANLTSAVLVNTTLRGAQLQDATFSDALLRGVDLKHTQIQPEQLQPAKCLKDIECDDPEIISVLEMHQPKGGGSQYNDRRDWFAASQLEENRASPQLDLRGYEKVGVRLSGFPLEDVDLRAGVLSSAILINTTLVNADLRGISLPGARLDEANLHGADARAADLRDAELNGAILIRCNLRNARLAKAKLQNVQAAEVSLRNADLSEATFTGANLSKCDASYAILTGAILTNANLAGAQLNYANLQNALLDGPRFDLTGADLSGANMAGAILAEPSHLYSVASLCGAVLPDGATVAAIPGADPKKPLTLPGDLRFSHWDEEYLIQGIKGPASLDGCRLRGVFVEVTFSGVNLGHAHLSGTFYKCRFEQVDLRNSVITGTLNEVTFQDADISGASLAGASLVACIFNRADPTEEQLRSAVRLRGTKFGESPYTGQYRLQGDIEDAIAANVDPTDERAMSEFCRRVDRVRMKKYQRRR